MGGWERYGAAQCSAGGSGDVEMGTAVVAVVDAVAEECCVADLRETAAEQMLCLHSRLVLESYLLSKSVYKL